MKNRFPSLIAAAVLAVAAFGVSAAAAVTPVLASVKTFGADCAFKVFQVLTRLMHRQGLLLTALFYADLQNVINGPAFGAPPTTRLKVNKLNGRVRYFESMFVAPAAGAAPAIADKIVWGKLPLGARFVGHLSKLYWNAGTAACTLNLGDNIVPARHLAATAITALGNAVPEASAIVNTGVGDITIGSNQIVNLKSVGAFQVGMNIVGAGIPLGAVITAIDRNSKSCWISSNATATTASLAITTTGGGYEATDDSNSVVNGFASTTDDATLCSVVAGAQVANNQVIVLKAAYVQD